MLVALYLKTEICVCAHGSGLVLQICNEERAIVMGYVVGGATPVNDSKTSHTHQHHSSQGRQISEIVLAELFFLTQAAGLGPVQGTTPAVS